MTDAERFWSKVAVGLIDDCWEWLAGKSDQGYGYFLVSGKPMGAHRFVYASTYGEIPEGINVCHHCDNKGCVNPTHLFLGTDLDNSVDAKNEGRLAVGEMAKHAKLTEDDVIRIRKLARRGNRPMELAQLFSVSSATIICVIRGKTWAHVPGANSSYGLSNRGERNGQAVLTARDVLKIRREFAIHGNKTRLAREFGVSWSTIYNVIAGRSWQHI